MITALNVPGAVAAALLPEDATALVRIGLAVAAVAVGTALALFVIFLWAFLTDPRRQLALELRELQAEVEDLAAMLKPRPEALRVALRLMRDEERDNRRLVQGAHDRGQFWRVIERSPRHKYWDRHRDLIAGEPDLEEVWERGRAANAELERVLLTRATRAFVRWKRHVVPEDRLPDVIRALDECEESLTSAIDRLERH